MRSYTIARFVAAGLLFVAIGDLPYDYYTLMRFVVCLVAGFGSYVSYRSGQVFQVFWTSAFGVIALLFNPFAPIRLERDTWAILDVGAGALFLASVIQEYANHVIAERRQRDAERVAARAKEAEREAAQTRRAVEAEADRARRAAEARIARQQPVAEAERLRRWQERVYKK